MSNSDKETTSNKNQEFISEDEDAILDSNNKNSNNETRRDNNDLMVRNENHEINSSNDICITDLEEKNNIKNSNNNINDETNNNNNNSSNNNDSEKLPDTYDPYFTWTAKDLKAMHYSAHIIEKLPNQENEDNNTISKEKRFSITKLFNVTSEINDETVSKQKDQVQIFEKPEDKNENNLIVNNTNSQNTFMTTNNDDLNKVKSEKVDKQQLEENNKQEETKQQQQPQSQPQIPIFSIESSDSATGAYANHQRFVAPKKARKLSGMNHSLTSSNMYRFSIINEGDNESTIDDRSLISYQKINRRKSITPNQAFASATSEEVIKARKLSVFSSNNWNAKPSKFRHRISIQRPDEIFKEPLHHSNDKLDDDHMSEKRVEIDINSNHNTNSNNQTPISMEPMQRLPIIPLDESIEDIDNKSQTVSINSQHSMVSSGDLVINILSIVYGLLMSITGIAICIASVVNETKSPGISHGKEIFFDVLYMLSIIWLVFCIWDINNTKKKDKKAEGLESSDENRKTRDRCNKLLRLCGKFKRVVPIRKLKENGSEEKESENESESDGELKGYLYDYKFGAGGLYLKAGVGIFCMVSLINSALIITENIQKDAECRELYVLTNHIIFFLFQFIQFCFIFKHSNLIIHRYKRLSRLAVMNIVVANLCSWIRTIILETEEQYHMYYNGQHASLYVRASMAVDNYSDDCDLRPTSIEDVQEKLAPYLYPATVEYTVTSLTIFFIIWMNIGKKQKSFGYILKSGEMETTFNIDCHKSSRGLFAGIIILLCTVVANILYFIYKEDSSSDTTDTITTIANNITYITTLQPHRILDVIVNGEDPDGLRIAIHGRSNSIVFSPTIITEIIELTLITMSGIINVCAYWRIRKLTLIAHGSMVFDETLVVLSLTGIYVFSVFSVLAIIYSSKVNAIAYLTLTISILAIVEGTLQTGLILNGLRRRVDHDDDKRRKPGRELFTVLILINLSLWITDTFAFKKFDASPSQLDYYSILAWSIISSISSPLAVFFRFHSSVCLSDCWKSIYL